MKAVVLMAGAGKRMATYYEGPKQLLPVNGKPVVEYLLDQLVSHVDGFVFVVGGPNERLIQEHFASGEYKGVPITFVRQEEQLGLAHAFRTARDHLSGRWIGSVGDDIFGEGDLSLLIEADGSAVLAYHVPNPENFGVLVTDDAGNLLKAVEKPKEFVSDLVWAGAMVMDEDFFAVEVAPSARGEYETPDVWTKLIQERGKKIKVVRGSLWLPVNDKAQLDEAERILRSM
ncbi:MAG TPA: sugar phosphate nucleotidyltransferase [Dehalococcoidia bacterium]|nr:sugar phosphate nucleotidyltransferase [Dehalococcoidia bacterium]